MKNVAFWVQKIEEIILKVSYVADSCFLSLLNVCKPGPRNCPVKLFILKSSFTLIYLHIPEHNHGYLQKTLE